MLLSAEIRWFWRSYPEGLHKWFCDPVVHGPPGGGGSREDSYLIDPNQGELGVKKRGNVPGVEVKALVDVAKTDLCVSPFLGRVEFWTKINSGMLKLDPKSLITLRKVRWLRKFRSEEETVHEILLNKDEKPVNPEEKLPQHGCNVEFTEVTVQHERWWTFGFEAFGNLETVENSLKATAYALSLRRPIDFPAGMLSGYPSWLAHITTSL